MVINTLKNDTRSNEFITSLEIILSNQPRNLFARDDSNKSKFEVCNLYLTVLKRCCQKYAFCNLTQSFIPQS